MEDGEEQRVGQRPVHNNQHDKADQVTGFAGWVVSAELTGASWQTSFSDSMLVFSIHTPAEGKSYARQFNAILDGISRMAYGRDIILGGDFNLTITTSSKSLKPTGKQYLQLQARLSEEFGLLNCWDEANPDTMPAQTLRWTGNRSFHITAMDCLFPNGGRSI